jgi:hypothetical protein
MIALTGEALSGFFAMALGVGWGYIGLTLAHSFDASSQNAMVTAIVAGVIGAGLNFNGFRYVRDLTCTMLSKTSRSARKQ